MNTKLIATAADVIHRAQQRGTATATGLAVAPDSAQLLQSPETAEQVWTDALELGAAAVEEMQNARDDEVNTVVGGLPDRVAVEHVTARRAAALLRQMAGAQGVPGPEGSALPWAHAMSDADLHGFLSDLVSAALDAWRTEPVVPDREVLAGIERVCAEWRTPGQGAREDAEPEPAPSGRLSPEREQEILARVDAATPGPWAADGAEIYQGEASASSPWIGETIDGATGNIAAAREIQGLRARVAHLENVHESPLTRSAAVAAANAIRATEPSHPAPCPETTPDELTPEETGERENSLLYWLGPRADSEQADGGEDR